MTVCNRKYEGPIYHLLYAPNMRHFGAFLRLVRLFLCGQAMRATATIPYTHRNITEVHDGSWTCAIENMKVLYVTFYLLQRLGISEHSSALYA